METTAREVTDLFRSSAHALRIFEVWRTAPERRGVPDIALAHVSRQAYAVTPLEVERLRDQILLDSQRNFPRTGKQAGRRDVRVLHPLATIKPSLAQDERAEDWSAPMSFNLAFHTLLERAGGLFTYPEFRRACEDDEPMRSLLWASATELYAHVTASSSPTDTGRFLDAMHWRVGCAYYAFVKEVYILASVRARGYDLRLHPLADTLFRTDFWTPNRSAVSVYVPNQKYAANSGRRGRLGRKAPMEEFLPAIFGDQQHRVELPIPRAFGTVDLPKQDVIDEMCRLLDMNQEKGHHLDGNL